MPSREHVTSIGRRRGDRLRRQVGELLESHRLQLGLSLAEVAAALGTTRDRLRRWELAEGESISLMDAAIGLRLLGQDLVVSTFPAAGALRDEAHARLIARFLAVLPAEVARTLEAPIPTSRDLRAWDVLLNLSGVRVGVAAETRLRDAQELVRRERQKMRDSGVERLLLVLGDSWANRRAVRDAGAWMREAFPLDGRTVWAALRAGRDPGGDGLLFV